jgi:hypothetical protein
MAAPALSMPVYRDRRIVFHFLDKKKNSTKLCNPLGRETASSFHGGSPDITVSINYYIVWNPRNYIFELQFLSSLE